MIAGPALALFLAAQAVTAPPPSAPPPPPPVAASPSLGTSAALWCPPPPTRKQRQQGASGQCSEGVAIPIGNWRSIFHRGSGQLLVLVGSKSSGGAIAHVFASGPHLSVAIGLGAAVPYEGQSGLQATQGILVGVLEIKP